MTQPADVSGCADWIGREQLADDTVALGAARRMAALLDRDGTALKSGDALPAWWYGMLCTPFDPQSALAADGHPHKGQFLPPVALPRRSMGGRRVAFQRALRIGDEVLRRSTILGIVPKSGRSGPMVIVTVRHAFSTAQGEALVTDEQDIIYRGPDADAPAPAKAAQVAAPQPAAEIESSYLPDTRLLFRFSAITFNAHRVHYDAAYAREAEGHAALVVNGSLTTLQLWDLATRHTGRVLTGSQSRNLRPLFVDQPVALRFAMTDAHHATAWALNPRGERAVEATLAFAPA